MRTNYTTTTVRADRVELSLPTYKIGFVTELHANKAVVAGIEPASKWLTATLPYQQGTHYNKCTLDPTRKFVVIPTTRGSSARFIESVISGVRRHRFERRPSGWKPDVLPLNTNTANL